MPLKRGLAWLCSTLFQPMWGCFTPLGSRSTEPGKTPRHSWSPSAEKSNRTCNPMHTPKKGRPSEIECKTGFDKSPLPQPLHRRLCRALTGQYQRIRRCDIPRLPRHPGLVSQLGECFLHAPQVARPVVDYQHHGPRLPICLVQTLRISFTSIERQA